VLSLLRNLTEIGKLPADLRAELEAEGVIFTIGKVGVSRRFSGHVPGVYSASGISRYSGGFGFSQARVVATFPARATITNKGLEIEIDLHGVDPAFSGSLKLNYRKTIPDGVLGKLPATSLRYRVEPSFVYRAAGVRPKS
jgi:hypothetical protein